MRSIISGLVTVIFLFLERVIGQMVKIRSVGRTGSSTLPCKTHCTAVLAMRNGNYVKVGR